MSCGHSLSDNTPSAIMFALANADLSRDRYRLGLRLLRQYRSAVFTSLFEPLF
jgi:hypothetical protein